MNPFQKLLNEFIDAKEVTVYALAKISGVERSYIQKMKNGTRMPNDEAFVHSLAQALMLTPAETMELVQAYRITKMGEDNFYRREHVKNIITSFCDTQITSKLITHNNNTQALDLQETHAYIDGTANINKLVKAVLDVYYDHSVPEIREADTANPIRQYHQSAIAVPPASGVSH